ncbi:biosynthetic arginine decarboxylase [Spirulina major CS-329]|uniref:biosynthetic arginine decarboxylase n=1 Tax=Spirulina TaxID=1154 RepID=UPI00232DDB85|nr:MULTISPECIES: biosynthetic arginine decarboxylase [Spirulina]MDB9494451.1 biosynthetic arginine decarboxylase [Spirulina subsalsa CS-330]MDB9501578.1 biosynthetic arginine decarboxylase [Spirulina major CS-329]
MSQVSEPQTIAAAAAAIAPRRWSIEASEALYRVHDWGEPYFAVNAAGHVMVSPLGDRGGSLDLYELVEGLQQRNLELPLLIRFPDILGDRIERLNACFARAIARYRYPGTYRGVYPIKCNQNRHLIETLVQFGEPHQFGLEAGSKPELMIALASLPPHQSPHEPPRLLICNGYKDREYIETALLATRLGHTPVLVIEQLDELRLILDISQQLNILPNLGVRAKLNTKGSGHWGNSTGDRAKFGLTIPEILAVVQHLEAADRLSCLHLLHFHVGSQICAIRVIKDAIREAAQIYVELAKLGAKMQYLDVGGGLAVDYDGSKTQTAASKNYNMQNYANDIVAEVQEACDAAQVTAPTLVSESGRAIVSHQSVLIFDILNASYPTPATPPTITDHDHLILRNLWETYETISLENYQEAYHDAVQFKTEAISLFGFGYLSLAERAKAEQLYGCCCHKIFNLVRHQTPIPDDLKDLEQSLTATYTANLSVFQSAPDSWAISQLFPIMPIHRLTEEPTERAILADLTCDSDGKIDRFIDAHHAKNGLELHALNVNANHHQDPYYLGMFLVGAYQEIMGNLHNLFGNTNVAHIRMTPKGYHVEQVVRGDTMREVLGYVQYDADHLLETLRQRTEIALQEKRITLAEAQRLLQTYEQSLNSYTYLTSEESR